ncbi:peptidoglycan DD-metalloendopeptidase family protein [Candidatus Halobeggiatoa sp. HSG11]|nr:peptidoglycan DD-metalloendopeptidase family protein [Candidatus Halobeggiatoa sp. HSG11]
MIKSNNFLIITLSILFVSCTTVQPPPQPNESFKIKPVKIQPHRINIPTPSRVAPPIKKPIVQTSPFPIAQLPASLLYLRNKPAVPGGIAWISLLTRSNVPPVIKYQNKQVLVLRNGQQWIALVGIPLTARIGQHTIINQDNNQQYSFKVTHKRYKVQRINIKNKRKVNPAPSDLRRIRRERELIRSALASPWRPTTTSPLPLMQPIRGRLSSFFGTRRYFNGQRRSSHTGLDIAAPQGTLVGAAAAGKIVRTGNYFFTGNTVIIDHGQGIVTLYGHLNSINVFSNQIVQTGEVIGTVGKTGRATGPHLHWSVSLNQNMIDPTLIMK